MAMGVDAPGQGAGHTRGQQGHARSTWRGSSPFFPVKVSQRTRHFCGGSCPWSPHPVAPGDDPGLRTVVRPESGVVRTHSEAIRKHDCTVRQLLCGLLAIRKDRPTTWSTPVHHKLYRAQLHQGRTGCYTTLLVFTVATVPPLPGVRPCHPPPFGEGREAWGPSGRIVLSWCHAGRCAALHASRA